MTSVYWLTMDARAVPFARHNILPVYLASIVSDFYSQFIRLV